MKLSNVLLLDKLEGLEMDNNEEKVQAKEEVFKKTLEDE